MAHTRKGSLRRFFVDTIIPTSGVVSITGKEAGHISTVLRMKPGDPLLLADGKGNVFEATIETSHHREVEVRLNKSISPLPSSPVEINLCLAVIKSRPMDYVIRKTTELGTSSITPFYSERTVTRIKKGHVPNKMHHWREIMKSACKQCGRLTLPVLKPPVPFQDLIKDAQGKTDLKILLWENEDKAEVKNVLRSARPPCHVLAIVGPEGGFTMHEIHLAREGGFQTISMGNRILRTETAAVSLISIIQYEWGDLNTT